MTAGRKACAGALIWIVAAWARVPNLHHGAWAEALLWLVALVISPLLIELVADATDDARRMTLLRWAMRLQFPAAVLLVGSFWLPVLGAVACAFPWAVTLVLLAIVGLLRVAGRPARLDAALCRDVGLMYSAIGAAWLLADRIGLRPLGFDPAIVLLTAVHFHYAGMILPVLTGCAVKELRSGAFTKSVMTLVIAGVPAVAVGITATQLAIARGIEAVAALVLGSGGLGVAWIHFRLARQLKCPAPVRTFWWVAAACLSIGMALAVLYGARSVALVIPWLDLPWMRALHGTVNGIGFGLCGTLAWWKKLRDQQLTIDQTWSSLLA